jgi:prophage tail gpP-like protein
MPSADRSFDTAGGAAPKPNEVRVNVLGDFDNLNDKTQSFMVTGWTSVRITRSIEYGTSYFEMTCTADAAAMKVLARDGAPVEIFLGQSQVLAGYIDTAEHVLTAREHVIVISGRGRCSDLIDCSCRIDLINPNTKLLDLCKRIANPYQVDVFVPPNGTQAILDALPVIPRQIISITETAWEVIERCARYFGLLVFESEAGELTVSTAGTELGSGLAVGKNIEAITCTKSTLGTFSTYNAVLNAYSASAEDEGIPQLPVYTLVARANRLRPMYFVTQQSAADRRFIEKRTNWMAAQAYGRSRRVRILTDGWRDSEGSIWIPNINYTVSAPVVGIPDGTALLLAEVTFILDRNGRHAELVFGPRQGFIPEPVVLDVLPMDESLETGAQG